MHSLARHLTQKLKENVRSSETFGKSFSYKDIYFGNINNTDFEYVTVEEFIEGDFCKYINNNAECSNPTDSDELTQKAEFLSHFSFEKTEWKLLLTDIQGCLYELCDPELASTDIE